MANAFDNLTRLFQHAAHEYGTKPLQEQAKTAQIIDQNNLREATTKSATKYNLELKSIRQRMDAGEFDDESGSLNLESVQQARITARDEFEQSLPDYTSREHLNYRDENWAKVIESNKQNVISSVVSQTELQENDFDIGFQEQRIVNNANKALTEAMSTAFQGGSRDQVEAELNRGYRVLEQPVVSMASDGTLTPTSVNAGDEVPTREEVRKGILLRPDTEMRPIAKYKLALQYEAVELGMTGAEYKSYLSTSKANAQTDFNQQLVTAKTQIQNLSPLSSIEERRAVSEDLSTKITDILKEDDWLKESSQVKQTLNDLERSIIRAQNASSQDIEKALDKSFEGRLQFITSSFNEQGFDESNVDYPTRVLEGLVTLEDGTKFLSPKIVNWVDSYFANFMQNLKDQKVNDADAAQAYLLLQNYGKLIDEAASVGTFNSNVFYEYANEMFGPLSQESFTGDFSPASKSLRQTFSDLQNRIDLRDFYAFGVSTSNASGTSTPGGTSANNQQSRPVLARNIVAYSQLSDVLVGHLPDRSRNGALGDYNKLKKHFEKDPNGLGAVFLTTELLPNLFRNRTYGESDPKNSIYKFDSKEEVYGLLASRGYSIAEISRFSRFLSSGNTEIKIRQILKGKRSGDFNSSQAARQYNLYEKDGVIKQDDVIAPLHNGGLSTGGTSAQISGTLVVASQLGEITPEEWNELNDKQRMRFIDSFHYEMVNESSYNIFRDGRFLGRSNIDDPQNPFFKKENALTISQDNYKSISDHPIASRYQFPLTHDKYSFGAFAFGAAEMVNSGLDAISYLPGTLVESSRAEVTDYLLATGLVDQEQIDFAYENILPDTKTERVQSFPGFGNRAYGPRTFYEEDLSTDFSIVNVETPIGEATVAEGLKQGSPVPSFFEVIEELGIPSISFDDPEDPKASGTSLRKDGIRTTNNLGTEKFIFAIANDEGLREFIGSLGPQGARFIASVDYLTGQKYPSGRAVLDNQSQVKVQYANLLVAQNPEWVQNGPISLGEVFRLAGEKNRSKWVADGNDLESFPSELDLLAALDIDNYESEPVRTLAALPAIAHTGLRHAAFFANHSWKTIPHNTEALIERLKLNETSEFIPYIPREIASSEAARFEAAVNEVTHGIGVLGSANEINDMIRQNALIAEKSLILPYKGTETVIETMDAAIDAMRGVGTGTPVNAALPLGTSINMRDALGPFLDGDLQEGIRVNVQTGDGQLTDGMITVIKDADTINTVVNYTDPKGNNVSVELTGRLAGLKASEVFDENFRRGTGKKPYSQVGGKEATRFFAALLDASGNQTTIVLSGEKGTFGRELIDVKLGPKSMDWTELAVSLGIGQLERRFVAELPDFANREVTAESVEAMRKQFIAEVDTWQNARVYNAPQSGAKIFPTSHPYVTNEKGGTSNVRLSTYEQNDIHYVVPSMVDGKMVEDPFGVARQQGLHNYPSFRTAEEALRFSKEQHGNITPDGIWLPTSKPSPENKSAVFSSMFQSQTANAKNGN